MAITSGYGQTVLTDNWLPDGWQETHEAALDLGASVTDAGNVEGTNPGFEDFGNQDFHLTSDANAGAGAGELPSEVAGLEPDYQYIKHQQFEDRPVNATIDIGAFERE